MNEQQGVEISCFHGQNQLISFKVHESLPWLESCIFILV